MLLRSPGEWRRMKTAALRLLALCGERTASSKTIRAQVQRPGSSRDPAWVKRRLLPRRRQGESPFPPGPRLKPVLRPEDKRLPGRGCSLPGASRFSKRMAVKAITRVCSCFVLVNRVSLHPFRPALRTRRRRGLSFAWTINRCRVLWPLGHQGAIRSFRLVPGSSPSFAPGTKGRPGRDVPSRAQMVSDEPGQRAQARPAGGFSAGRDSAPSGQRVS